MKDEPFRSSITDFYLTNPIARASAVMAKMERIEESSQQGTEPRGGGIKKGGRGECLTRCAR